MVYIKARRKMLRIDVYQAEKLREILLVAVVITGMFSSLMVLWL